MDNNTNFQNEQQNHPNGFSQNGFIPNGQGQPQTPLSMQALSQNSFTLAAIVCATLSWLCSCFAITAIMFGSLAIIFALLSRGNLGKMTKVARSVIIASTIAMVFSIGSTILSVRQVFNDPQELEAFKQQYEMMTGTPFDEDMELIQEELGIQLFGE